MPDHGTRACWVAGCRRPECREANRLYYERRRRDSGTKALRPSKHGTRARYNAGCGCGKCRKANTVYYRERRNAAKGPM